MSTSDEGALQKEIDALKAALEPKMKALIEDSASTYEAEDLLLAFATELEREIVARLERARTEEGDRSGAARSVTDSDDAASRRREALPGKGEGEDEEYDNVLPFPRKRDRNSRDR